jgi:hypothetical protein
MSLIKKESRATVLRSGFRDERLVRVTTYRLFGVRIWKTIVRI